MLSSRVNVTEDVLCKQPRTCIHSFIFIMPSFHELQELLLLSHDFGAIDDEDLLLLFEEFAPKNYLFQIH